MKLTIDISAEQLSWSKRVLERCHPNHVWTDGEAGTVLARISLGAMITANTNPASIDPALLSETQFEKLVGIVASGRVRTELIDNRNGHIEIQTVIDPAPPAAVTPPTKR